jgi:CBS domain-containing protein
MSDVLARDLLARSGMTERRLRDAATVPLAEIMSDRVVSATPGTTIQDLAAVIAARGVSGVPVVDPGGRAVGIVTRTDLVRWAFSAPEDQRRTCRVVDLMTRAVLSLPREAPIARAAALMSFEGVHRIVVTRADGSVCGMLSAIDVLNWVARNGGYVGPCPDPAVDPDEGAELGEGD